MGRMLGVSRATLYRYVI
ncbi:hypothetical protein [Arthrobacter sp.]